MNTQQLSLFRQPTPEPVDTLPQDICAVRSAIEWADRPLTSREIAAICGISRDRVYHALNRLHKQEEIGWVSRATWEKNSRATSELEQTTDNDSSHQVARPKRPGVARPKRPLKVKGFLKGGSDNRFYYWLCRGNLRLAYIGGRVGSVEGRQNKAAVELAIASGRFEGCQLHSDYKTVIHQVKLESSF